MTIGILPCAGKAERFGGLPKYLLPCPGGYLLERHVNAMREAGCDVRIGCNLESFGILDGRGDLYRALHHETMTQTVLSILLYEEDNQNILFGMPDTYFAEDWNIYKRMAEYIERPDTDVMVAMFEARPDQHKKMGMVKSVNGLLVDVVDKPEETKYTEGWGALAWKPSFWQYLKPEMPHVGFGLMEAVKGGLEVRTCYTNGDYYDCGDRDSYFEMIRDVTCESE